MRDLPSRDAPTFVCAHRGDSGPCPENTLAAFRSALGLGVEMIEFDVAHTSDGRLVLLHDPKLERTTNGAGLVYETDFATVRALDAGSHCDPRFAGERIPTLEETLELIPDSIILNVHVKAHSADPQRLVRETAQRLLDAGRRQSAFIASDPDLLREVSRAFPGLRTCPLLGGAYGSDYVQLGVELGCRALQPGHRNVTPEMVAEAHENGLYVNVFYADEPAEMLRLIDMGVDGILTNWPERLLGILGRARTF